MSITIRSAIAEATATLKTAGIDDPRTAASLLLMHVLGRDRTFLVAHDQEDLTPEQADQYRALIARRATGYPVQYLTGHQEFFGLDFEVTPDVLVPRPETELVVSAALRILGAERASFADIGTGSGCIAVSVLNALPHTSALAVDASTAALAMAQRNAERHGVLDRLRLVESDLFSAVDRTQNFDLIVSNPPYVPAGELKTLQREVRHEPQGALDGGPDGLAVIRRLLKDAPVFLRARGYLVFEIGWDQAEPLRRIIDQTTWELIDIENDLQGIPRTVALRKKS